MLVTSRIESAIAFILILILGILFLTAEWNGGRKYLREKRRKELDKMKTHDMK
jgi:putative Mn2+ efflux pump MntP